MQSEMVRAYVESMLEHLVGVERVVPDHDGDYPVRLRSALYYVRIIDGPEVTVQVFSVAVDEIEASPELLSAINDLNSRTRFVRVFWIRGQVLIEADLVGDTVEPRGFGNACDAVASTTDQVAVHLARTFGGRAAFEEAKDPDYESPPVLTGMYL